MKPHGMNLTAYEARCKKAREMAVAIQREFDREEASALVGHRDHLDGQILDQALEQSKDKALVRAVRVEQRRRGQVQILKTNHPSMCFFTHHDT